MFSVGVYAAFGLLLPRLTSAPEVGLYTLMSTLLFFGSMTATFGVPILLVRQLAQSPHAVAQVFVEARRTLFWGALWAGLGILGWLAMESFFQSGSLSSERWLLAGLLIAIMFFDGLGALGDSFFQAHEKMGVPARTDALTGLLKAGGGVFCLTNAPEWGLFGVFGCFLLGSAVRGIQLHSLARRQFVQGELPRVRAGSSIKMFREASALAVFRVLRMLRNRMDVILIGLWIVPVAGWGMEETSDHARALYGQAMRVMFVFHTLTMALNTAVFPRLSRLAAASDSSADLRNQVVRVIRYQAWWSIPLATVVFLWSDQIAGLFGEEYRYGVSGIDGSTAEALRILSCAVVLDCVGGPMGMLILGRGKLDHWLPRLGGILAGFNLLLNFLMIPRWGILGAAWASLATASLEIVMKALISKKLMGGSAPFLKVMPYVFWAVGLGWGLEHFLDLPWFFEIGALFLLYGIVTGATGLVDSSIRRRVFPR